MVKIDILGVPTDAQSFTEAANRLGEWLNDSTPRYVCTCPVYTIMLCYDHAHVQSAVAGADMVTADGMPVVWLQRRRGAPSAERVYGPDLMLALCRKTMHSTHAHFFLGGAPGVADRVAARLQSMCDHSLTLAGTLSPGVPEHPQTVDHVLVERLNASGASIIWVGLGSPKQDLWMALYRPMLRAPLLIGVGAAFDIYAGVRRQAPRWMRDSGLEWLFRFAQEPGRLAQRYLVYNPRFIWHVLIARR